LRGGKRTRVIADYLIGAHAGASLEHLLTRDRGFYRTYFADVVVGGPYDELNAPAPAWTRM
jgi:predicted nucleic acid-binding protein